MMELFTRKRIDILVDEVLSEWLAEQAAGAGIPHYSLLSVASGRGRGGHWREDDGYGSMAKQMFVAVSNETKIDAFVRSLAPHIEVYGLVVTIYDVQVVRGERF